MYKLIYNDRQNNSYQSNEIVFSYKPGIFGDQWNLIPKPIRWEGWNQGFDLSVK